MVVSTSPFTNHLTGLFDAPFSYDGIFESVRLQDKTRFTGTLEFFPQEGKYHEDGHRACNARATPAQTREAGGLCRVCGKPPTIGVLSRVEALSTRRSGKPDSANAG